MKKLSILIILFFVLSYPINFLYSDSKKAEELCGKAFEAMQKNDIKKTYEYLKKSLEADKTFSMTYLLYAYTCVRDSKVNEAIEHLAKGYQYTKSNDEKMAFLKLKYTIYNEILNDGDKANKALDEALKVDPKNTYFLNEKEGMNIRVGKASPDLILKDLDGKEVKLSSLKGKVVLIDVFATWCGPCRNLMPETEKIWNEFKTKDVVVLGINIEGDPNLIKDFVNTNKYTFPIWLDTNNWQSLTCQKFKITGIPIYFLIDKTGVFKYIGHPMQFDKKLIEECLK